MQLEAAIWSHLNFTDSCNDASRSQVLVFRSPGHDHLEPTARGTIIDVQKCVVLQPANVFDPSLFKRANCK